MNPIDSGLVFGKWYFVNKIFGLHSKKISREIIIRANNS